MMHDLLVTFPRHRTSLQYAVEKRANLARGGGTAESDQQHATRPEP